MVMMLVAAVAIVTLAKSFGTNMTTLRCFRNLLQPIIVYHILVNYRDLSDSNRPIDTTVNLFDAEMRYLYDNGFKVITMADLGYDENTKSVYIKGT
jgi:hypothetical protein